MPVAAARRDKIIIIVLSTRGALANEGGRCTELPITASPWRHVVIIIVSGLAEREWMRLVTIGWAGLESGVGIRCKRMLSTERCVGSRAGAELGRRSGRT